MNMPSKKNSPARAPRLRASVFRDSLVDVPVDNPFADFTCHIVEKYGSSTELNFYTKLLRPEWDHEIPACFHFAGLADKLRLTDEEVFTCRIVALSLAALLVEDGFYVDGKGEIAQRKRRKKSK
jgi:hypothetical protein